MRLLHSTTYQTEEFIGEVPHYVILSHTWGKEEVTYDDIQNVNKASKLKGHQKLVDFCTEAARHGFKWVWMDTCCIDKRNAVELSEAINSMFKWYQRAVVCYVYLQDFAASSDSDFITSGGRSRWFTRGWTLQELLAPSNMVFYDRNWRDVGTKQSLSSTIASITGIDHKLLVGATRIRDYSVAQKMSWASLRRTTRIEDMAYCLLGLFNIALPTLYGEGWKAFQHLQEMIVSTSTDQTIFAWQRDQENHSDLWLSRGILASSPADFRDSGRIVSTKSVLPHSTSYTITNKGLEIDLPVVEAEEPHSFLGILECYSVDRPGTLLAIVLRPLQLQRQDPSLYKPIFTSLRRSHYTSRLPCRRVESDPLKTLWFAGETLKWRAASLIISPVCELPMSPAAAISRFPRIDLSMEQEMGNSGYCFLRSSSFIPQDLPGRLMSYMFSKRPEDFFCVKMQWCETKQSIVTGIEIKIADEVTLEDWTTQFSRELSTDAEAEIGTEKEWIARAKVRYKMKESRSGQDLSLFLKVSVTGKTAHLVEES